jgi:hypothetical protein
MPLRHGRCTTDDAQGCTRHGAHHCAESLAGPGEAPQGTRGRGDLAPSVPLSGGKVRDRLAGCICRVPCFWPDRPINRVIHREPAECGTSHAIVGGCGSARDDRGRPPGECDLPFRQRLRRHRHPLVRACGDGKRSADRDCGAIRRRTTGSWCVVRRGRH